LPASGWLYPRTLNCYPSADTRVQKNQRTIHSTLSQQLLFGEKGKNQECGFRKLFRRVKESENSVLIEMYI
jgi:hypothetical protein